jgi:hypothetical protein
MTNVYGNVVKVQIKKPFVAPPTGSPITLSLIFGTLAAASVFAVRRLKPNLLNLR